MDKNFGKCIKHAEAHIVGEVIVQSVELITGIIDLKPHTLLYVAQNQLVHKIN